MAQTAGLALALFRLRAWLKYHSSAADAHGIQSPFVYQLYTQGLKGHGAVSASAAIEAARKRLLADQSTYQQLDFGAGKGQWRKRVVSQLARVASLPAAQAEELCRIAAFTQPQVIIELGTCLGLTTAYLASAFPQATVLTFEGCPNTAAKAQALWQELSINNITCYIGNIFEQLPQVLALVPSVDFVWADADHSQAATLQFYQWLAPKALTGSIFAFDDIYHNSGMATAWQQIILDPAVQITIDRWRYGMLIFKPDQAKEHFILT